MTRIPNYVFLNTHTHTHVNSHSDEFRPTITSKGTVPKMTFNSDPKCKFRGRPPNPQGQYVARKTHRTHENSCAPGYGLLQRKDTDYKQPREKAWRAESRKGGQTWNSHCPPRPPASSHGHANLPTSLCDNMHRVSPRREAHLGFSVHSVHWRSLQRHD